MAFPDSWPYRKKISIKTGNLDASQSGFPLCVPIIGDTAIGSRGLSTGYDIRFTDAAGTEIPYERESFAVASGAATGVHWVKCNPSTAGTDIYVYYGNSSATDGADAENVWDANYSLVYHMKDATTSTVLDSTTNDNDGNKKGAGEPAMATGQIATAQDFAGDHDYILPTGALFDTADVPYTISMWFQKTDNDTGSQMLFGKDESVTTYEQLQIGWAADGAFNFSHAHINHNRQTLTYVPFAAATIDDSWHYISAMWDGAALRLFADGSWATPITSVTTFYPYVNLTSAIGKYGEYAGYYFNGLIDEFRISGDHRSAEWTKFEYANMSSADNELTWGPEEQLIRVRRPHGAFNRPRR